MRDMFRIVLLLALAMASVTGCKKEPEAKSETKPAASADAGVARPGGAGGGGRADTGARATGGVFNDPSASQPTTRP